MTIAVVVLWPVVIAAGALVLAVWWRSRSALLAQRARRRVIVTLKTSDAFQGVLYATDGEALVLREAQALGYGAKKANVPVEGELVVLRADVAYIQVLPTAAPVATEMAA